MPRVLVIDWNLVYAKKVAKALRELVPTLEVDTATNSFETERRLEQNKDYDLILVDAGISFDPGRLRDILSQIPTPKIFWTVEGGPLEIDRPQIHKPQLDDIMASLSREVVPALRL